MGSWACKTYCSNWCQAAQAGQHYACIFVTKLLPVQPSVHTATDRWAAMSSFELGENGEVIGLGFAAKLVQVNIGIGLAIATAGSGPGASSTWAARLRSAADASGPALLLAAYGLVQAQGAPADLLTWSGLLLSTVAVVLDVVLGTSMVKANGHAADASEEAIGDSRTSCTARAISSLRALGQVLAVFGSVPSGLQLCCASLLLRSTLIVSIVGACGHVLALDPHSSPLMAAQKDAERLLGLSPMVASIALLDLAAWGPTSIVGALVQPMPYCTLACLTQANLAVLVCLWFGRDADGDTGRAEFDLGFGPRDYAIPTIEPFRRLTVVMLYGALATSAVRLLAGTFTVEASSGRFAIYWNDPLFAAACLLAVLFCSVYTAEYVLLQISEHAPAPHADETMTNGADHGTKHTTIDDVKAIVAPTQGLVLALVAASMTTAQYGRLNVLDGIFAALPFRYGFIVAAFAVGVQVALLLAFTMWHAGSTASPHPVFDGTGTLQWEGAYKLQRLVRLLLVGGLVLGWTSLGVSMWLLVFATIGPVVFLFLPPELVSGLWTYLDGLFGKRRGAEPSSVTTSRRHLEEEVSPPKEAPKVPEKISLKGLKQMAAGKAKSKPKKK